MSANGIRFHIAEAGDGPLVVLLHGFAQYWWSWRHQLPGLAAAGYRVVAPDLRGYGDSDRPPRGYDAFTLAADVAGLIRALGERNAVVVGHGYGGVTGFNTAAMYPDQVRALVAIAAPHPMRMARLRLPVRADRYGRLVSWAAVPGWPERRLTASGGALVERIVRSQAGPAWKASADFADTMRKVRRAILIPGTAHTAVEQLRWVATVPATGRRPPAPGGLGTADHRPGAARGRRRGLVHPRISDGRRRGVLRERLPPRGGARCRPLSRRGGAPARSPS